MKTPLLSICIATYNRGDYIGETIESIIPQLDDDVELLVIDGASTDNTEEIVRQYARKDSRIRYIRLAAKGGVDQDYDQAVEFAKGEYCWLFTDDDLLKAGAIKQVLYEISQGHSLIIVNSEVWNKDFAALISEKHLDKAQNVYGPHEFDCFFQHCVSYLSFIGAIVIKKNIWKERDKASYFGTEFVHIGVIFQKLLPGTIRVLTDDPYIKIRYGNAHWSARKFEIWMIKWPELLWSFEIISQKTKQNTVAREPWRNLKSLFVFRGLSAYNSTVLRKLISNKTISYSWLFFAKCISLFPVKLANRMLLKYYAIRGKAKDLTYYDLLEGFTKK